MLERQIVIHELGADCGLIICVMSLLEKAIKKHIKESTAIEICEYHIKSIKLTAGEAVEGIVFCAACF